ncbi:MAG TPA: hypothetical protein VKL61_01350, partial [Candidatus Polarisedimenticolia bacterium]|nr:hypothetical protein [Candidatus Polarisedimenticolia bacterium]
MRLNQGPEQLPIGRQTGGDSSGRAGDGEEDGETASKESGQRCLLDPGRESGAGAFYQTERDRGEAGRSGERERLAVERGQEDQVVSV